ncbi:unnamed protein product [Owenia fusiformis]|uniref:NTF2-related export protein n=1 Tax=Owenia fusiformis TaxID=6347 RepID=A0A8S4NDS0_OWEFU|nr:unnamed protein product [Owenia fusiformis]
MNQYMNPDLANEIGQAFVQSYYTFFDSLNLGQLITLYGPDAQWYFEDKKAVGHEAIKQALGSLTFKAIQHVVTKIDCQPTVEGGVLVLVTGRLKTDDDPPHAYSQVFYIKKLPDSYFLFHDMFRLSIHDSA